MNHPYQLNTVVWEITMVCNMKCIHCGTGATLASRDKELSTAEALNLIDQIAELNAKKITLSGGEPFLRKDWSILAEHVLDKKMRCGIVSNGVLVNNQVANKLKELRKKGNIFLGISIDGYKELHDEIRRHKSAFEGVHNALKLLHSLNFPVSIITQVNSLNISSLNKIRDFIFSFPNVYTWQIQVATPWGRAGENDYLIISPKQFLSLCDYVAEQKIIYGKRITVADDIGYYTAYESIFRNKLNAWKGCHAGTSVIGIRSNGDVTGCLSLMEDCYIEGNIRNTPLKEIWEKQDGFKYNREFTPNKLEGHCKECQFGTQCRAGCKNLAISLSGSPNINNYCCHYLINY